MRVKVSKYQSSSIFGSALLWQAGLVRVHCLFARFLRALPQTSGDVQLSLHRDVRWDQWEFQDPKMEVPTICKAYVRGYPPKIWPYMVQYLHFRILEFPLIEIEYVWTLETTGTRHKKHSWISVHAIPKHLAKFGYKASWKYQVIQQRWPTAIPHLINWMMGKFLPESPINVWW